MGAPGPSGVDLCGFAKETHMVDGRRSPGFLLSAIGHEQILEVVVVEMIAF